MPIGLTPGTMERLDEEKRQGKIRLKALIEAPFDVNDSVQMKELLDRLNRFELSLNRMHLFNSVAKLLGLWGASRMWSVLLPMPEGLKMILNYSFYLGVAGLVLKNFNMNDFHQEYKEMRQVYNWVLKGGRDVFNSTTDNSLLLKHPYIQRMIILMAPLCTPDFMIAWKPITDGKIQQQWAVRRAYNWTASWFSPPKKDSEEEKLEALKQSIERGDMKMGLIEGIKHAANNPSFRMYLMGEFAHQAKQVSEEGMRLFWQPVNVLKDTIPELWGSYNNQSTVTNKIL